MEREKLSVRQYLVLVTVGLMPALVKLVPGHQAIHAGRGAWLAPLAALLPALGAVGLIAWTGLRLPEGSGLGEFYCHCLGKPVGRLACALSALWLTVVSCFALRFCAERFVSAIYPDTRLWLFLLVLLGLGWGLCRSGLAATARAGELFFYAIVLMLVLILALVLGEVRWYCLWPVWIQDVPRILQGGTEVLNIMSTAVGCLFLFSRTDTRRGGAAVTAGWMVGLCVLLAALAAGALGTFGAALVARMQIPFFSLAKEVKVERLESLVAAAWVFADVVLLSILLRSAALALEKAADRALPGSETVLALLVLAGSYLAGESTFALERAFWGWETVGKDLIFLGLPLAALLVGKLRRVL